MTKHRSIGERPCQHQYSSLSESSYPMRPAILHWTLWSLKRRGLLNTLGKASSFASSGILRIRNTETKAVPRNKNDKYDEVLNLRPGELVEVKSVEETMKTLDSKQKNRGLAFMPEMQKYCGKRFKVYKRVARIILESTGEIRRIRNTVLLEGVLCDGLEHMCCDRSCFHYWREVWLKRVDEKE